jgi:BirA family biotin operon repressor/biotin-[acetyl-CoA-carboxylase] ligase
LSSLNPIGIPFIELLSVDSTNNYAMGLARAAMAHHGMVVFTHEQTKGKGQRNRHWISSKNQNLAMSIVLEPQALKSTDLFALSMASAIAVHGLVTKYTGGDVKIKWPNDIYWCDRKAGGILIENVWQGDQWKFAVVGIGININQTEFGELAQKAVSLKQITGKDLDPMIIARELCLLLEEQYRSLTIDQQAIHEAYRSRLYRLNEKVRLKAASRVFEATVENVTFSGQLVVRHAVEERFEVGDLEWLT